jgi:hypothetical protein
LKHIFVLIFLVRFFIKEKMNKEKKVSTRACPQTACTEPEGKKKVKEKKEWLDLKAVNRAEVRPYAIGKEHDLE